MKIETPRLTLRDFTPADGPALHAILGDGEVMAFAEPPYTPAQTQAFLEQFCIARRGGLACVEKATGQLVGYLLFSPPGGAGVGAGVVFPPRHLGQRLCHRGKPGAALPRFPNPLRPGGRRRNHRHRPGCPCAGETVVSPGRRPAGGIARRGEDPAVSIRPSCQGLGTGKIETEPENSSAVSPCLVRFGEGT